MNKKNALSLCMIASITASTCLFSAIDFQQECSFTHQFFKAGDIVFDIGAHVGKKTDIYLAGGAKVVCFEPQPSCIQKLHDLYDHNPHVIIVEKGLGDTPGMLELAICSNSPGISTFSQSWQKESRFAEHNYTWDKKATAEIITLDQAIAQYGLPTFCKIDVENFEYQVLKGLSRPIAFISFECHEEKFEETKKCVNYLKQLGYNKFNFSFGTTNSFAFDSWKSADEIMPSMQQLIINKTFYDKWGLWGDMYAHHEASTN